MIRLTFFWVLLLVVMTSAAQSRQEANLLQQVEAFRLALISGKRADLAPLVSDRLSYGHSNGRIEDKEAFLRQLETGTSDFVTVSFNEQVVRINGPVALVRHELRADIKDGGVPASIRLHVLLVWQREGKTWKLLARQSTRL
ncbi:MAG TPA: nuclear transport factor 2 family protein [Lacibacter sp.]|nr:nuclear transport factor 2 family protein [Lacibacter sp.]HMO89203.1 nuclear transport factor 2 family protein [Lacibacter sp.]HMP88284.1 nuclear transport factor 2 family protein [Lacibacter sp.]